MFFIDHAEALGGTITIVEIRGPLNAETSPDFETYINRLLERNKTFIALNMGGVDFVSSTGIGLMLYIQKMISARNGFLVVYRLPPEVRSLYALLGFDKIFTVAESKDEALRIIEKQSELRETPTRATGPVAAVPSQEIDAAIAEEIDASPTTHESREDGTAALEIPADKRGEAEDSPAAAHVAPAGERTPDTTATPTDAVVNDAEIDFSTPLIVECTSCRSLVRVMRSGSYLCPDCHASFTVERDQTIIF